MKFWKILIILVIVFILIVNLRYNNKTNNTLTILQLTNPHKDIFEENISQLSPSILTEVINPNLDINIFSINELNKLDYDKNLKITKQNKNKNNEIIFTPFKTFLNWIIKNYNKETKDVFYLDNDIGLLKNLNLYNQINDFAKYYLAPFTYIKNYSLSIGNKFILPPIEKVSYSRFIICQLEGTRKYYLFNPEQEKYLYKDSKLNNGNIISKVNFWKTDSTNFPEYNKSQFMEIIIRSNQMIYIPKSWWYCYENNDNCVSINIQVSYLTDYLSGFTRIINV